MSELKRAIFALKRSLKDFKEFSHDNQTKLPDNFLWGVLSFIKSILQVDNKCNRIIIIETRITITCFNLIKFILRNFIRNNVIPCFIRDYCLCSGFI